ncbi:drug/metabolite transporter (DMT)-like permease [Rubricella aquisinus]|uniref:Drug/metabolite transporter (DMT)-like permease n=1 Tax=Rubricella aquisinus TaxID=2028108 RepID=A0A840WT39_9RHOB|nr:DMT family transporter [Rubricella aquisinus]MBB5516842.1 drug/metabolite transporter (DMT)-like permease [Rubricella aquisinus]
MIENKPLAALFMLTAAAFVAGSTLFAKALGVAGMHPFQVSSGRFIFALLGLAVASLILRPRIIRPNLPLHTLRVVLGWLGVTCMFAAVAVMPVGEATAISFLNPIIAMILAIPLLGERVGPWRWAAAVIAFAGALILIQPGADAFQPAALIALLGAVFMGAEVITIKRLTRAEKPLQILIVNNVIGVVIACSVASFVWVWPTPLLWGLMAGTGLLMVCAQACFLNAMGRADASFVGPVFYATLVFAALYDFVIYGVVPVPTAIAGALLILAGAALMVWRESRKA